MNIKVLGAKDASRFKKLRLIELKEFPNAFGEEDPYFNLSESDFMVNYRVNNLDLLLNNLRNAGVEIVGDIEEYDFGRFAWVLDPDGHKVELWEPNDVQYLEMLDREGNQLYNTSN